jgi:hypothetical protein
MHHVMKRKASTSLALAVLAATLLVLSSAVFGQQAL